MKLINLFCLLFVSHLVFGQLDNLKDFENETNLFLSQYVIDGSVDYKAINTNSNNLSKLVTNIAELKLSSLNDSEKQSFLINAYNIIVIDQINKNYPSSSVKEIPGFFNKTKYKVGDNDLTLNEIEKDYLLKEYNDSRFHFALVCGAKDCPKIWNQSFTSESLNEQLDNRTKKSLNDPDFLRITDNGIGLSEIFKWNRFEFGGKKDLLEFINRFRDEQIDLDSKIYYYNYDWTLNDSKSKGIASTTLANNSFRYVTSAAIPKEGIELKIFNNLYSQKEPNTRGVSYRSTFFTTSLSFLYGLTNRFNVGFASRYRRVRNSSLPSSALDVFQSGEAGSSRQGITAFGPQIRWAPIESWTNFSIQSSLTIPIGSNLSGTSDSPFIDWAGPVFWTQFFNDKTISDKFSLFTEIDLLIEEIGGSEKFNRVSTPMTVIFSWFPKKNLTLYGLVGYSPFFVSPYDYFNQYGIGAKYQISPDFEIELLATDFNSKYLNSVDGSAATYNIGFRYSR